MKSEDAQIVIVEDSPSDVELTLHSLQKHKLTNSVKVLGDGEQALDYIFAHCGSGGVCPHLVLLDLKLPKVDGLEVLQRIRSDERTKLIPVVVLTSSGEDMDRVESYRLGVNSYIVKPVGFDDFDKVIAEIGQYWMLLNRPPFD